jgi:hypothetical protein
VGSAPGLYNGKFQGSRKLITRVEAVSNTSTVTLRVIGGDEMGSLKSGTVKYGRESQGTRTRERLQTVTVKQYTKTYWLTDRQSQCYFDFEQITVVRSWEFSWWRVHLSYLFSRIGSSSGEDGRRWLRRNGKKGIRLYKKVHMCDLKLQWDCEKSVARIWLMKTENPSACVTVNCKVCRSAIALYCL